MGNTIYINDNTKQTFKRKFKNDYTNFQLLIGVKHKYQFNHNF